MNVASLTSRRIARCGVNGLQKRWRHSTEVRRSDLTRSRQARAVTRLDDNGKVAPKQRAPSPTRSVATATGNDATVSVSEAPAFQGERIGLGSASIHAHYDRPGLEVETPDFLKVPKTAAIIGCPMSWGQPRAGVDVGSQMLRDCGLENTLLGLEWRLDDRGDLQFEPPSRNDPQIDRKKVKGKAKNCYAVGRALKKIHDEVYKVATRDEFALVLGGDHSISAGSVSAILKARPDTGIIWVDAHGDLNTPETSPSGNLHGCPLGIMLGLVDPTLLPGWEWMADCPKLKPEQLVFVGLRDLDSGEREVIIDKKIKAFTMYDVDKYGIGRVMDMATSYLGDRPLHLSYDIDAVDPELAPATGTVVRGGFNYREAHFIAECVAQTNRLGSMDLVEVNPSLATNPDAVATAQLGMALIASAMGSRIL